MALGSTDFLVVLLHSPLLSGSCWGRTSELLRDHGIDTLVVDVQDDEVPPFATRYIKAAADSIKAGYHDRPVILVGHSGAGPLLPAVGAELAGAVTVAALIYCDANLARPAANRLDLMEAQRVGFDDFREELANGRQYPDWTDEELAEVELVPDPGHRELLLGSVKRRREAFFLEPLPYAPVDATVAQGYLRLCAGYERAASEAQERGWPVMRLSEGHFHALVDPTATAAAISGLARRLVTR
jgi:hypothetical protein